LVCQLVSVAATEVRRLRKVSAPHAALGGRPKLPDLDTCLSIVRRWQELCGSEPVERQRYVQLHRAFGGRYPLSALEAVLADHQARMASMKRFEATKASARQSSFDHIHPTTSELSSSSARNGAPLAAAGAA
jgi:hypothetical protein